MPCFDGVVLALDSAPSLLKFVWKYLNICLGRA